MLKPAENPATPPSQESIYRVISQTALSLGMSVERSMVFVGQPVCESDDPLEGLLHGSERAGIHLREIEFRHLSDATAYLSEGYPIIIADADGSLTFVDAGAGRRYETIRYERADLGHRMMSRRKLRGLLLTPHDRRAFVAKRELECASLSQAAHHHHGEHDEHHDHHHHEHLSPIRRFLNLLALERRDISITVLFAFVAGILTLATPLAVESLVNVVSWGVYLQPLVVLGLILLVSLGLAGILRILQNVAVEVIQRRQFVRIVGDLAHRFPRAKQSALKGEYPRELANRIFDIMTIQKATAVLLLDGISILLTAFLGMVLLGFYHPFLLGFDVVLLISMISITWVLGRGGIRTAIDESITKYRVVHWLQDVLSFPSAFKVGGGEALAIDRANELTSDYLQARRKQYRVVIRQTAFAIMLQVGASTAVLALGGWLVIQGQLTLGQLVASELVVTVVVGAFAKAGKSLEKYYDLMAGVDKVGHLIDIPADPRPEEIELGDGPAEISWTNLAFKRASSTSSVANMSVSPGSSLGVLGDDVDGKSDLAKAMVGLVRPDDGFVRVGEFDPAVIVGAVNNTIIGYAGNNDVFVGTIRENVDLGRSGIGQSKVRDALDDVALSEILLRLGAGLQTPLKTGGYPLTDEQAARLMLARAMAGKPKLLVINGTLDRVSPANLDTIWNALTGPEAGWTLVLMTSKPELAARCSEQMNVRRTEHVSN